MCISLYQSADILLNPLSQVQLVITHDEELEARERLNYQRQVHGTPFTFGDIPLEIEFEVADVCTF